jgi:hypothetical protein
MGLKDAEISLTAADVKNGVVVVHIKDTQEKATKYGSKILAKVKDEQGRRWVLWLNDSDIRVIARYLREHTDKNEDELKLTLGIRTYTPEMGEYAGQEREAIEVQNVE